MPFCDAEIGLNGSEFCRIQSSRLAKRFEQQDESCCPVTIFSLGQVGTRLHPWEYYETGSPACKAEQKGAESLPRRSARFMERC